MSPPAFIDANVPSTPQAESQAMRRERDALAPTESPPPIPT